MSFSSEFCPSSQRAVRSRGTQISPPRAPWAEGRLKAGEGLAAGSVACDPGRQEGDGDAGSEKRLETIHQHLPRNKVTDEVPAGSGFCEGATLAGAVETEGFLGTHPAPGQPFLPLSLERGPGER